MNKKLNTHKSTQKGKKYIRKIGKETNFQIILNLKDKNEIDIVLRMLVYLALDIDSQEYLINHGAKDEI
jgi:hypothetical protein